MIPGKPAPLWATVALLCAATAAQPQPLATSPKNRKQAVVLADETVGNRAGDGWLRAVVNRMDAHAFDSIKSLRRVLTDGEEGWRRSIAQQPAVWNGFRDSLAVPFGGLRLADTVAVMVGFGGADDAFTFEGKTLCFDLTALHAEYGDAAAADNRQRLHRFFAHEYTHLLSKEWLRKTGYRPRSFRDSVLWECWYEGLGLYRSLSAKWLPAGDGLPLPSRKALAVLVPQFRRNLSRISKKIFLSEMEKAEMRWHLSRGAVHEKWGALPVALWLALEAAGDERRLRRWVRFGPEGIPALVVKYTGDLP